MERELAGYLYRRLLDLQPYGLVKKAPALAGEKTVARKSNVPASGQQEAKG